MTQDAQGFSLPELITAMLVTSLLVGVIMVFGFNYWRFAALQSADQDTLISRLNAGDFLRQNIGESSGLIIQNGLPDDHVSVADPAQPSGKYWLPIHAVPRTTSIGSSGTMTPLLYYRKFSVDKFKNVILNGSVPYEDEYVLYLNGTTKQLLAHAIANSSAPSNKLVSTCPPASASSSCPADTVVADNVFSIGMRYFSRTGTLLDYTSSTDTNTGVYNGPDFPLVEVIEFTVNLQAKPLLEKTNATQNNTIIRIALRDS